MGVTPLLERHRAAGARLVDFAGWEMPLHYPSGVIAEHKAVRDAVGLFDVSHLGAIWVEGPLAAGWLNRILTNDLSAALPGRAQYTLLLNDDGGVIDDIIVWHLPDGCWVIPNAANTEAVVRVLAHNRTMDVGGIDRSADMALLALQGPGSAEVVRAAGLPFPGRFEVLSFDEREGAVGGTGYTGEPGIEILIPGGHAADVWDLLLQAGEAAGIATCGLGARDTLRLEMGYPLHGHEMDETVTPFEAGLGWVVALDKGPFRGRDAIAAGAQSAARSLVGIDMRGRDIPRQGCPVLLNGDALGVVTSGNFSPVLGHGIALARVDAAAHLQPGTPVEVDIRGRSATGAVVKPPFIGRHH